MNPNKQLITCTCSSYEHNLIADYHNDDNIVYLQIHLEQIPLWDRIKYAVKYIFGYKSKYGAYSEFLINKDNIDEFKWMIDKIENHEAD